MCIANDSTHTEGFRQRFPQATFFFTHLLLPSISLTMSTPARNTRSRSMSPVPDTRPRRSKTPNLLMPKTRVSTPASTSKLATQFATALKLGSKKSSPVEEAKQSSSEIRSDLVNLLEKYPTAHVRSEVRDEYAFRLERLANAEDTDPSDVLFSIGVDLMGVNTKEFKIAICGDGGVGKTSLIHTLITQDFNAPYVPTQGADVKSIIVPTNQGYCIKFNCWDIAGVDKFGTLRDGFFIGSSGCIVLYDALSRSTHKSLPTWYRDFTRVCQGAPVAIACNKVEKSDDRKVGPKKIGRFLRQNSLPYSVMSVKTGYGIKLPFLHLARKLTGDDSLEFINSPALQPPPEVVEPDNDVENVALSSNQQVSNGETAKMTSNFKSCDNDADKDVNKEPFSSSVSFADIGKASA